MSAECPISTEAAEQCGCPVCVRSVLLCGMIEHGRLSDLERGAFFDLVADWWALAHAPEDKTGTAEAGRDAEKTEDAGDGA